MSPLLPSSSKPSIQTYPKRTEGLRERRKERYIDCKLVILISIKRGLQQAYIHAYLHNMLISMCLLLPRSTRFLTKSMAYLLSISSAIGLQTIIFSYFNT